MGLTTGGEEHNIAIVASTYEGSTSEENGRNLAAIAAESIEWTEAAGFPYAGTYVGLDEIIANVFARLASEWDAYHFVPEKYIATGDEVVAIGTYHGRHLETGKAMTARVAHIWRLEDSAIVAFEQIVDSHPVREAMRP